MQLLALKRLCEGRGKPSKIYCLFHFLIDRTTHYTQRAAADLLFHKAGATTPVPQCATTCFPVRDLVAWLPVTWYVGVQRISLLERLHCWCISRYILMMDWSLNIGWHSFSPISPTAKWGEFTKQCTFKCAHTSVCVCMRAYIKSTHKTLKILHCWA